jgi:hypothetical protein
MYFLLSENHEESWLISDDAVMTVTYSYLNYVASVLRPEKMYTVKSQETIENWNHRYDF